MKRIAHLIQVDGPGGGPHSVSAMIAACPGKYESIAFCGGSGRIAETCKSLGIEHHRLPIDKAWKWPWGGGVLFVHLLRTRPDILFLHGQWISAMGAILARIAGVRRIVYVARWPAFYTDWDFYRTIRNYVFERIPCVLAHKTVVLSESSHLQYLVRRCANESKLVLIPNAVNLPKEVTPSFVAELRKKHGWSDDVCHVVCAGRLADQKRVDWLLLSWVLVQRRGAPCKLWLVGDGAERPRLEKLAKELGVTDSCVFLGNVPNAIAYVAAADVVVVSSLYESFCRAVVEAMVCGKPFVTTLVDGTRDLARDGCEGFMVPPGDTERFAQRLIELAKDHELRDRMGKAGLVTARKYSSETVMPQYEKLVSELLAEKQD